MWHFRGIFIAGTYMAIRCEVDITVACVLAHLCKNLGLICPCSIMAVWLIFAI